MIAALTVNGRSFEEDVRPDEMLYDYLRRHGFKSVKCGCDTTNCGLCTVWMDGTPVLSCSVPVLRASGHEITTLEGVRQEAEDFGRFMAAQTAEQCGFCNTGFIMNVLAMVRELENPTIEEIQHYLEGNLCRCTGYEAHLRALRNYLAIVHGNSRMFEEGEVPEDAARL
ncbi:MAG: 2Fe-2S iron-sulfur cluster-binding protein [Lachnospiraceae bacterium]|nr:2Fe-2S iron-sulfur cluster-binding protein [Lachnospiraceae bacterium]